MEYRILLVEDEEHMREVLSDFFTNKGSRLVTAENGKRALEILEGERFDAVLLDIMMPELDGFTVCRQIRKHSRVPVIFLTARSEEDDKLYGYGLGADDYVTKPFSMAVLYAKLCSLINRARGGTDGSFEFGGIELEPESRTVRVDGDPVALAPKEYGLLLCLMENRGRVLSRNQLLCEIWGYDFDGDDRVVDTHIKKLRAALGARAGQIRTVLKAGYKFEEAPGND